MMIMLVDHPSMIFSFWSFDVCIIPVVEFWYCYCCCYCLMNTMRMEVDRTKIVVIDCTKKKIVVVTEVADESCC